MNMKKHLPILAMIFLAALCSAVASAGDINVISYYAARNYIDGQLLANQTNVIRFFPVFAHREDVTEIEITIYYGSEDLSATAKRHDNGRYWEAELPPFDIGQSVQRIEALVTLNLDSSYRKQLEFKIEVEKFRTAYERIIALHKLQMGNAAETDFPTDAADYQMLDQFAVYARHDNARELNRMLLLDAMLQEIKYPEEPKVRFNAWCAKVNNDSVQVDSERRDSLIQQIKKPICKRLMNLKNLDEFQRVVSPVVALSDSCSSGLPDSIWSNKIDVEDASEQVAKFILNWTESFQYDSFAELMLAGADLKGAGAKQLKEETDTQDEFDKYSVEEGFKDDIRKAILEEIQQNFTDSSLVGARLLKADIVIEDELRNATILYRNDKQDLRKMPALDPTERRGIFRLRYIPIPVTRIGDHRLQRIGFAGERSHTVFEVGVAFGDAYVASDEMVPREISIRKLGVAMAITEELFSNNAELLGVALTYDISSFVSLGAGANLANETIQPYFSFGVNRQAFEALTRWIGDTFE